MENQHVIIGRCVRFDGRHYWFSISLTNKLCTTMFTYSLPKLSWVLSLSTLTESSSDVEDTSILKSTSVVLAKFGKMKNRT
jgi:hypothetical protein